MPNALALVHNWGASLNRRFILHVLGSAGVIDALDLDQTRLGVGGVLVPLVAEVTSPKKDTR